MNVERLTRPAVRESPCVAESASCLRQLQAQTPGGLRVTIVSHQRRWRVDLSQLEKMVQVLLAELRIKCAWLEISLLGTREMTRLNEAFLRHAGPTDVIAFDYGDDRGAEEAPVGNHAHASKPATTGAQGEIFVCGDEAVSQARRYRTTWPAELVRYVIHGVLHLCGHDDVQPAARRRMKRAEDRLLRTLRHRFPVGRLLAPAGPAAGAIPRARRAEQKSLRRFPLSGSPRAPRLRQ
jgi:probable rRNA maturation factor